MLAIHALVDIKLLGSQQKKLDLKLQNTYAALFPGMAARQRC